ncbi:MAG: transcription antitermination factor NusB [Gammaproteobacteria bacterium]|nr:transcription antitermination factor NusB [Gammaproteobacteria bacterium]
MSRSRSKARHCAVQAIYQWQVTGNDLVEIFEQFLVERNMGKVSIPYFKDLLYGVVTHLDQLDTCLQAYLDRSVEEVDGVERAVLRMGAYELMFKPEVPYRVAINEALEAVKVFGAEQGFKYVNGVLDKVAQQVRAVEIQSSAKSKSK